MANHSHTDQSFLRKDLLGTHEESTFSGALSFCRRKYSRDLKGVDVAVVGVPCDLRTTNRPGARFGPRSIRAASAGIGWNRLDDWGFDVFDRLAVVDYGDVNFDHGMPETVIGDIEKQIADIIKGGTATLCLGGDHFISYPVLRAQAAKHGPLALVHFDAHSDTWKDETPRIDHGNMFWHAANEGLIVPQQSVQVGLRTFNKDTHGFNWLKAACVHQQGVEKTIAEIRRVVGDRPCYLTFDIDCLDPAYAPGTGTPVIGGLSSWQAQHILRGLAGMNFVAMDLVEVAPIYDVGEITSVAGATLALESLYLYSAGPRFRERC